MCLSSILVIFVGESSRCIIQTATVRRSVKKHNMAPSYGLNGLKRLSKMNRKGLPLYSFLGLDILHMYGVVLQHQTQPTGKGGAVSGKNVNLFF